MIYLDNKTTQQDCWIPRNDYLGVIHTGSTHSYQEGYEDGIEHQKGLLASTAFTENGVYTREDGWNEVDVSVDIPTPVLEDKTVVISADTTNVIPSSGYDGMSAVTVDASEYAQSNYDSGFEDGFDDGYSSGSTDGFDSGYTSGHTDGVDEEKAKLSATTFTANTAVTISDGGYSAITVNVPQTGTTAVLGVGSFSENGTYSASTDNLDGYSAITVNVQAATASTISVTGNTWYVLDHKFRTGEKIEVTNATFASTAATVSRHQQLIAGGGGEWVRIGGNGNDLYTSYYGDNKITYGPIVLDDDHILLTNGAFYINDMTTPVRTFGPYSTGVVEANNMVVFANTSSGGDKVSGQTATVGVITIYDENDNIVAQYVPELHNGAACFYNPISDTYISPSGTGTPSITLSQYDEGYSSGYTDGSNDGYSSGITDGYQSGYTSGYTDGSDAEKALLSAITFTANTAVTLNSGGYSAITVNLQNLVRSLYVSVNGETKPVGYYTQSPTQWDIINEDYTTISTLEIMYVHYYNHKLHIYLLTNGKYGYWNENDNDPQPQSITTINGSATTQDELSTYTLAESGSGLVVTSSNGSNYEVLFCEKSQNLGIGSFSANGTYSASTDNLDGYSAITVNVPTGSTAVLGVGSFSANGTYSASTDNLDGYSAITVSVPTSGAIKYIDYIETDGSQIIFDTGIKIGSDDTSFEVELDFMPLRAYGGDIYLSDEASRFNLLFRIWDSNFQTAFGNLAGNANITTNNRYDVTFNYASNSGNVKCNGVDVVTNQRIILNSHSYVHSIYLNYGIYGNCPSARYYKLKITKDGVDHIFNPCLDGNNVPCLYDEYNGTYIYNTGSGTPIAGPTSEFISGYTSGYTSGITLGETNRKCVVFESLNYPAIHIYTTANKYYIGNGYKTIIDFYIDNNGSTTSGVTNFGVKDMSEYGYNGFSIGPSLFAVESNALSNGTTYTQNPNPYGWQRGEVQLFYTGDTCYYSLYFNNEIFISSSFTRSTTVQNNYGIKIGIVGANDIAAIESVKTYDSLGDLVGYIVYDPETGLLKDLLDYQVQFSVSGNTADISGAAYI